jgi:hypothetical protein
MDKALYKFTDNSLCTLNKMHFSGIYCDLPKAFDCVNHALLLPKLKYYGIEYEV